MRDLSRQDIEDVLRLAFALEPYSGKGNDLGICNGEILANAFFEPSTRTRISFETAMHTMGGEVENLGEESSIKKGESLRDTVKTLQNYGDVIVIRHSEPHIVEKLAKCVNVPVINAGDGTNEHPTQALLDLYTALKKLLRLDGLKVALLGDLYHNRPAHSLSLGLDKFDGIEIYGISPPGMQMQAEYFPRRNTYIPLVLDMQKQLNETLWRIQPDIVYATRTRKEYLPPGTDPGACSYTIDAATMRGLKPDMIVEHPLPRPEGAEEISPEIDDDPRVVPFEEERGGVEVRMAAIGLFLGHEDALAKVGTPWFKDRYNPAGMWAANRPGRTFSPFSWLRKLSAARSQDTPHGPAGK